MIDPAPFNGTWRVFSLIKADQRASTSREWPRQGARRAHAVRPHVGERHGDDGRAVAGHARSLRRERRGRQLMRRATWYERPEFRCDHICHIRRCKGHPWGPPARPRKAACRGCSSGKATRRPPCPWVLAANPPYEKRSVGAPTEAAVSWMLIAARGVLVEDQIVVIGRYVREDQPRIGHIEKHGAVVSVFGGSRQAHAILGETLVVGLGFHGPPSCRPCRLVRRRFRSSPRAVCAGTGGGSVQNWSLRQNRPLRSSNSPTSLRNRAAPARRYWPKSAARRGKVGHLMWVADYRQTSLYAGRLYPSVYRRRTRTRCPIGRPHWVIFRGGRHDPLAVCCGRCPAPPSFITPSTRGILIVIKWVETIR